jgi:hypothetical protein
MYYDLIGYLRGYGSDQYSRGKWTVKRGNPHRGMEVVFAPNNTSTWGYRIQFLCEGRRYDTDSKIIGVGRSEPEIFISAVGIKQHYDEVKGKAVSITTEQPISSYCSNIQKVLCVDCGNYVSGVDGLWTCTNKNCSFNYTKESLSTLLKTADTHYNTSNLTNLSYMSKHNSESATDRKNLHGIKYHEQLRQWY